jgi:predicted phage baseplate assembly protein
VPTKHDNPPNLTTLSYRLGTHPTMLRRMLARLHTQTIPNGGLNEGSRPLEALRTRDSDDLAIALLDAWAVVADVLTFYQERVANEGYLRTATEHRSLVELAHAFDYRLGPGLAASTALAFSVEAAPAAGMPETLTVRAGLQVQSVPGPGQQPQTFETVEAIEAQPEWNALLAYQPVPEIRARSTRLAGAQLKRGDYLWLVDEKSNLRQVLTLQKVVPNLADNHTDAAWTEPPIDVVKLANPQLFAFRQGARSARLTGTSTRLEPGDYLLLVDETADQRQVLRLQQVAPHAAENYTEVTWAEPVENISSLANPQLFAFRQGAALFGHNAARWADRPAAEKKVRGAYQFNTTAEKWEKVNDCEEAPELRVMAVARGGGYWFAATAAAGLFRSKDSGQTWGLCPNDLTSTPITALHVDDTGTVYAGSRNGAIFRSTDHGKNWTEITQGIVILQKDSEGHITKVETDQVHPSLPRAMIEALYTDNGDGRYLWAQIGGDVYRSQDEGVTWEKTTEPMLVTSATELPDGAALGDSIKEWPGFEIMPNQLELDLDAVYDGVLPGGWVVLTHREVGAAAVQVKKAGAVLADNFGLSGKVTRLTIEPRQDFSHFGGQNRRSTRLLIQSERLPPLAAERPCDAPVSGQQVELAGQVPPLEAGRRIIVTGRPLSSKGDETVAEVAYVKSTTHTDEYTRLDLAQPLQHAYQRASVTVLANVALATHGETVPDEVLGRGDNAQANQRFRLKKRPLTYLPDADSETGRRGALEVRVNGVLWAEAPSLYELEGDSQSYIVRQDSQGWSHVIFGDGQRGARLLSSQGENVVATYRNGLGPAGEVPAHSLTLLQTRPLGVQAVTNPLPASGGTEPETVNQARRKAPLSVRSLDRIVSLSDFEAYAGAFAGVRQAQAVLVTGEGDKFIYMTLAGDDEGGLGPELLENLANAIHMRHDRRYPVRLAAYRGIYFVPAATVLADPRHRRIVVQRAVETALREAFAYPRRAFGQGVTAADVIVAIQTVPGVVAVESAGLYPLARRPTETDRFKDVAQKHTDGIQPGRDARPAELVLIGSRFLSDTLSIQELAHE